MGDSYSLLNSLPSALLPSLPLNLLSLRVNTADLPFAKSNGRFLFSFCFFLPWSIWPCWLPFEVLFSPWFCETTLLLSLPLVCPPTSLPGLSQATCHDWSRLPSFLICTLLLRTLRPITMLVTLKCVFLAQISSLTFTPRYLSREYFHLNVPCCLKINVQFKLIEQALNIP